MEPGPGGEAAVDGGVGESAWTIIKISLGRDWREVPFGEAITFGRQGGDRRSEAVKDQHDNIMLKDYGIARS